MTQPTPFPDPFDFMQKLWGQAGLPMAGMVPPLLDPQDLEKRIADMKSVEAWLTMNLNILRMTIQGLEMQKATLDAFKAMQPAVPDPRASKPPTPAFSPPPAASPQAPQPSTTDAWWALLQQQSPPAKPEKKRR